MQKCLLNVHTEAGFTCLENIKLTALEACALTKWLLKNTSMASQLTPDMLIVPPWLIGEDGETLRQTIKNAIESNV